MESTTWQGGREHDEDIAQLRENGMEERAR